MIQQRVGLLTLGAWDMPALRAFYQRLGWEEHPASSDNYAIFKTAVVFLALYPMEELAKDAGVEPDEAAKGFRGVIFTINVDEPEQVNSVIETVREAGARITQEPRDTFWGGRDAYFADPENNFWEVAWNPGAVFDDHGAMLAF